MYTLQRLNGKLEDFLAVLAMKKYRISHGLGLDMIFI